jgi:mRNA-degrading endonuclease toxin of MazEF toxin-antitoxin module
MAIGVAQTDGNTNYRIESKFRDVLAKHRPSVIIQRNLYNAAAFPRFFCVILRILR